MNFSIIETGGKQYRVASGMKLRIEKIEGMKGSSVSFDNVLLQADGDSVQVGMPYIADAKVEAEILEQGREKKKIVYRYHPKTRYHKKKGHRQHFTEVRIK